MSDLAASAESVRGLGSGAARIPLVRFHNVSKAFRGRTVLDGLDLSIHQGEKLALIGPSGSGKTTILRILMTLVRP
ncbi:MAG: ATP-binding cassette domain-containing protein, partial [Pseudonocardia sp.]|nr:ATP-binding cassette domain-containing protein [Pseudonocardia sp.]